MAYQFYFLIGCALHLAAVAVAQSGDTQQVASMNVNAVAVQRLRDSFRTQYSYRDLRGVDWDRLFADASPRLAAARTPIQFAEEARVLLSAAQDPHLKLMVGRKMLHTWLPKERPNINVDALARSVPAWVEHSTEIFSGRYPGGPGYILIKSWSGSRASAIEKPALDALRELADAPALIIDVRPNGGGVEKLARGFAGCFISAPKAFAKVAIINGGKFGPEIVKTFGPNPAGPSYRGKVAVLMGRTNASSCELFLLMMKQVPGCILVGERSAGTSGNPKPVDLGNGVTACIPSWKALRLVGSFLEGQGISPDVEAAFDHNVPDGRDTVLESALEALKSNGIEIKPKKNS